MESFPHDRHSMTKRELKSEATLVDLAKEAIHKLQISLAGTKRRSPEKHDFPSRPSSIISISSDSDGGYFKTEPGSSTRLNNEFKVSSKMEATSQFYPTSRFLSTIRSLSTCLVHVFNPSNRPIIIFGKYSPIALQVIRRSRKV